MSTDTGTAAVNGEQKAEETPQEQAQVKGNVPYARFQEVVEQRKGLESTLNSLIDGMICELPEEMRDLVPNLPPAEKAAWIRAAKERGLFGKSEAAPASSPGSKRPGGKPITDLSGLNPIQMMSMGYGHQEK